MDRHNEQAREQGNLIRFGTVIEVDLPLRACRIQTGEVLSDFVPWLVPRVGQTVEWSAPTAGEQVVLLCPEGDTTGAVVLRGMYSNAVPAPSASESLHLVRYADGAEIQYDHEAHALKATLPGGGTAEVSAPGGVTINGDLTVNGDTQINGDAGISGKATAQIDVIGGGKSLKGHLHLSVSAGSSVSGPPQ